MRYAKDRKEATRRSILVSACRRFATQGFAATSIDEIMRDCKLTRGGFYAHFKSKSQLYRDAIRLATAQRQSERRSDDNWIDVLIDEYLSAEHTAFFAKDIASEDSEVRLVYEQAFKSLQDEITNKIAAQSVADEGTVLALAAMIVGTIAIARSVEEALLKSKLEAACRESARGLLEKNVGALTFFWEPPTPLERARLRARIAPSPID